jgi:hypothetical protein
MVTWGRGKQGAWRFLGGTSLEIAGYSALIDAERLGDFGQRHSFIAQLPCSLRVRLGRAMLPAFIDASVLRQDNACGLALFDVLQFDLGNGKEHAGDKMPHGAAQVDLLGNRNHAHATLTPSR